MFANIAVFAQRTQNRTLSDAEHLDTKALQLQQQLRIVDAMITMSTSI